MEKTPKSNSQQGSTSDDSTSHVYEPAELIGLKICSRYHVTAIAGEGSMAHVFVANDERLETEVVLKIPKSTRIVDPNFQKRFSQERQLLVKLSHPHIVRIMDIGEFRGLPFVVMQNLKGGNLSERLEALKTQGGQMAPDSLKSWIREISRALDFVAAQGMVHRDVKPANIMFDDHGNAFLGDFGLTKIIFGQQENFDSEMTGAGYVVGTPNYMAPEIILGSKFDGRSDQYALAMVVYTLMYGRPPLQGETGTATMVNQTQKKLPLLSNIRKDIPEPIGHAVAKALAKRPDERFPTCEQFADAVLQGLSSGISSGSRPRPKRKLNRVNASSQSTQNARSDLTDSYQSVGEAVDSQKISRGKRGLVDCPACKESLPLREEHAGRIGRCRHCNVRLKVGKNLSTLRTLPEAGSQKKASTEDVVLGEKVFGWQLSQGKILALAGALIAVLVIATALLTNFFSKPSDQDILKEEMSERQGLE